MKLESENAVVCFGDWLTVRRGTLKVGEGHDPEEVTDLVKEFLIWNDLEGTACEVIVKKRCLPPRLWFRYTPTLGSIEWCIRKFVKDLTS